MAGQSIANAAIHLTADSGKLLSGLAVAKSAIGSFSKFSVASLGSAVASVGSKGLASAFTSLTGMASGFVSAGAGIGRAFAGDIVGGVAQIATGLAGAASSMFAPAIGALSRYEEEALAAAKAGKILGESTESMSKIVYAFGGDIGKVVDGAATLNEKIGEALAGEQGAIGLFKQLGIEVNELATLPIEEKFARIADGIASVGGEQGFSVMKKLLGGLALDGGDVLKGGAEKFNAKIQTGKDRGLIADNETAAAALAAKKARKELDETFEGAFRGLAPAVLPVLNEFSKVMIDLLIPAAKAVAGWYRTWGDILLAVWQQVKPVLMGLVGEGWSDRDMFQQTSDAAVGAFTRIASAAGWLVDGLRAAGRGIQEYFVQPTIEMFGLVAVGIAELLRVGEDLPDKFGGKLFKRGAATADSAVESLRENLEKSRALSESLAPKDLAGKWKAWAENIRPAADELRKVGKEAANSGNEINRMLLMLADFSTKSGDLETAMARGLSALGKNGDESAIDELARKFKGLGSVIDPILEKLRGIAEENKSIARGFQIGFSETPIEKFSKDIDGLYQALAAGKLTQEQFLAGIGKVGNEFSGPTNEHKLESAKFFGTREASNAIAKARAEQRGVGNPEDRLKNAIDAQKKVQENHLDVGRKMLEQLQKMPALGVV